MIMTEKRRQIEEDSLKKRIKFHEDFAKEQELKLKHNEEDYETEITQMKSNND